MKNKLKNIYIEKAIELNLYKNNKLLKDFLEINNIENIDMQVYIYSLEKGKYLKRDIIVKANNEVYLIEIGLGYKNENKHLLDLKNDINIFQNKGFRNVIYLTDNKNEAYDVKNKLLEEVLKNNVRLIIGFLDIEIKSNYLNLKYDNEFIKNINLNIKKIADIEGLVDKCRVLKINDIYKYVNNTTYLVKIINDIRLYTYYKNILNYKEIRGNIFKFGLGIDNLFMSIIVDEKKNTLKIRVKGNEKFESLIKKVNLKFKKEMQTYYLFDYEKKIKIIVNNIHKIINFILSELQ
ncbi:hypothetical protein ACSXD3_01550 [Clostridium perfringens]